MPSATYLERLFNSHSQDLSSVFPGLESYFVCPICFGAFHLADINNALLSIAHVWPSVIRERGQGDLANHQHVLLCNKCNSTAGSRGDKHAQEFEKLREGEETGELFGERIVLVTRGPGEEPIKIQAKLTLRQEDVVRGKITFEIDRQRRQWARNNPKEETRFRSLVDAGEKFPLMIHPYRRVKHELARSGWITSAYLLAFFSLGYRYVFQEAINPVRDYIFQSLYRDADILVFPESDDVLVVDNSENPFGDPDIGVVIPGREDEKIHLQISFLRYQIRLPFQFVPAVLGSLVHSRMPNFRAKLAEFGEQNAFIYIPIACTKIAIHDCLWDYVMGKPIPRSD